MSGTSGMGGADPEVMAAIERGNAVVFFDVAFGEGPNAAELGRIKLELFVKDVSSLLVRQSFEPSLLRFVLSHYLLYYM
jgi:hypothetical protein